MKINDIKEKFLYSFYNGNYLNYNYNIVIPILQKSTEPKENDVISFKIKNNTFFKYINDYNYDAHYKKIIFNKISFDFLKKTYNETKSSVLRGILLEEMLYYLFKENFVKRKTITIAISVYAKQKNFVFDNYLRLTNLDVCEKSQSKDDDFFEQNFNTVQNGIYFLFPQQLADPGNIIINLWISVRQNGKCQMENGLKNTAKNFGYGVHFCGSPSLLISRNFDAIFSNDS